MADLSYYQNLYNEYLSQISTNQSSKQSYLEKAEEIKVIYNRLSEDKAMVKQYKNSVKTLKNENFDNFSGTQKKEYKAKMQELIEAYQTVIDNIDYNMDLLNSKRAEYKSLANSCGGVIDKLRTLANSVLATIQNWTN